MSAVPIANRKVESKGAASRLGSVNSSRKVTAAMQDFADILGRRNVSDDPAFIASYSWATTTGGMPSFKHISDHRPSCIVMPASTEEVQAIVQTCLRHNLKYHPFSTGMGSFGNVSQSGAVSVDLRRMDKIIQLDEKNQMAVIEPYVTAQQLMAEAMKVGLTTHVIGAGWTHSPLASATSCGGIGISGHHTGQNVRNLMGYEWVTPEGEILRAGSAGAGSGWFAGEGPGPGFRGMIRGAAGAGGGLGIFTKIGYKLHPWHGPRKLEHTGKHPQYGIKLNSTLRFYKVAWPSWEDARDAVYEFMISNASTLITRMPADHTGWCLYPTNREFYDALAAGSLPEVALVDNRIGWSLVTVSESDAEAQWRDQVLRAVVEKTHGRFLNMSEEHAEILARNSVTSCYIPRCYRVGPRAVLTSVGVYDSFRHLPEVVQTGERLMKPYKDDRKTFCAGGPEEFWIWSTEGRHLWAENIVNSDNDTSKSLGDGYAFVLETIHENDKRPVGTAAFALGTLFAEMYGRAFKLNEWQIKVKRTFDPKGLSDGIYPNGEKPAITKIWPYTKWLLFKFKGLLRTAMRLQVEKG